MVWPPILMEWRWRGFFFGRRRRGLGGLFFLEVLVLFPGHAPARLQEKGMKLSNAVAASEGEQLD